MKEKHERSVVKSISWRVVGSLITVLLVFIFTGKLKLAISVGILEAIFKMLFYYLHERAWLTVKWGTK